MGTVVKRDIRVLKSVEPDTDTIFDPIPHTSNGTDNPRRLGCGGSQQKAVTADK